MIPWRLIAGVERLAADEAKTRRRGGNAERQDVAFLALANAGERIDQELVGGGSVGRQHFGATHDQSVRFLLDHAEVNKGFVLLVRALRAVALRIDDGMGQEQIAITAVLVVIPDVVRELLAPLPEEVRAFRPGHQHRVEIIGRATDHAKGGIGPDFHGLTALDEIGAGARDHEGAAAGLAVAGIGHDLAVLRLRLQIVELRDRLNWPPKDRIGCDVANAPARDPDLSRRPAQACDELFSVARCHQQLPLLRGRLIRRGF
jgi:hypothetical protein